jgi:2-polyprenyl-6-methoxyphenol hydroxylase-like FAD-dependent oxidoreductase
VDAEKLYDTVVVGAGPAGLFLASELGKRGLCVLIVGEQAFYVVD